MNAGLAKPATSRLFAILIFVGLPLLLAGFTALNIIQVLDDRVTIAEKQTQLAALQRRLKAPRSGATQQDFSSLYIEAASRGLASATLQQQLVGAIATASGRLIETLSVDPVDPGEQADDIRLKATLDIDNDGLLTLLHALESGMPLLEIETLSVRRLQEAGAEGQSETLRVDMMVNGHWKRQPAS